MHIRKFCDDIGELTVYGTSYIHNQDGTLRLKRWGKNSTSAGKRRREGKDRASVCKVDALSRGLVTHSLPESVPRVGPGSCEGPCLRAVCRRLHPGPLRGESSSSFLLSVRIRDSAIPAIRKKIRLMRTMRPKKGRSYVDVILESIEFSIPLPSNLAS